MNTAYEIRRAPENNTHSDAERCAMKGRLARGTRRPSGQFYETVVVVWLTLSVASVALALATWVKLSRQLNAASQAVAIRLEADSIFQLLLEAESSQRGFVITGDPNFLGMLESSRTNLPGRFEHLANLSRNDAPLLKRVMEFRSHAEASLNHQRRVVLAMQEQGPAAASALAGRGEGMKILDSIRRDVAALGPTPSALVFDQGAGARSQLTRASLTSLAAGILGLGAGLLAFGLTRLAVKHQKRERDLIQARFEAERRSDEKTAFLANMSHEIRTPMSAILGFGELLENDRLNVRQRGYLQSIRRSASSLLQLVNDMLDMSKIEAGVLELHREPTDPREISQFIQAMFAEPAARKHLNLSCVTERSVPRSLLLDRVRLRQILVNLVGNAVKFTDCGSVELSIRHEDHNSGERVTLLIDVKDTGVGIPAARLEAIFNPFVQAGAHPEKECQGSGLGLAIVKRLTEAMGGSVVATSEAERGSLFQLRFPDVAVSLRPPVPEPPSGTIAADFSQLREATILGVDDNETNRQLLQALLGASHHRLLLASNGPQAIKLARNSKPDMILLDLRLRGMDGYKVLKALRDIPGLQMTPVVAVTASNLPEDYDDIEGGFDGCLQKPFSRQDLFDEMSRFLPRTQNGGGALDTVKAKKSPRGLLAAGSASEILETTAKKNGETLGVLIHDMKSSLAGVIMSGEVLLEQATCANDQVSRRLVIEILISARLLLAWMKDLSVRPATEQVRRPVMQAEKGGLESISPETFKLRCGRMQADAHELRRQLAQRPGGHSAALAENIVRSCAELSETLDRFAAHRTANMISTPICLDLSEALVEGLPRRRERAHLKQMRPPTPILAEYGLSNRR